MSSEGGLEVGAVASIASTVGVGCTAGAGMHLPWRRFILALAPDQIRAAQAPGTWSIRLGRRGCWDRPGRSSEDACARWRAGSPEGRSAQAAAGSLVANRQRCAPWPMNLSWGDVLTD